MIEASETPVWLLRRGSAVVATLEVDDQDFPWNYGRILTTPAFEPLRQYFRVQSDAQAAKAIREELRTLQVELCAEGGAAVQDFTLIVEAERVRFQFR